MISKCDMGYLSCGGKPPIRLLMMLDPYRPYYHDKWVTDGSEGDFGRTKHVETL